MLYILYYEKLSLTSEKSIKLIKWKNISIDIRYKWNYTCDTSIDDYVEGGKWHAGQGNTA